MKENALLLCGFSYRQNNYQELISSAPKNWNFHKINYYDILKISKNNNFYEAIYNYLESEKIEKVNLIAHSLGGAYALNFAYHHPEKVKHMYLLNTIGIRHKVIFIKFIYFTFKNKSKDFRKHLKDDLSGIINILKNPLIHLKLLKYVKGSDLEIKTEKVKVPTTIIWGKKDYLFPLKDAEKLNKYIKKSKLVVLPDQGHDWPIHSPKFLWENI